MVARPFNCVGSAGDPVINGERMFASMEEIRYSY